MYAKLKEASDVYALPSPHQTVVASLGYRAAVADFLFAHVLVSQGLHHQAKRRYEFVGEYLDTINTLDPEFRDPYIFVDVLLIMSAEAPRLQEYLKAREILERGMKERPYDAELWLTAGQYLRFLAAPWLEDEKLKKEFMDQGLVALQRACDLGGTDLRIMSHCLTVAHLLDQGGSRDAAIRQIKRFLAVTDNPEMEKEALEYLQSQLDARAAERRRERQTAFMKRWGDDLTFISKDTILLLGPNFDPARCAGPQHLNAPACLTTWRDWGQQFELEEPAE